MDKNKVVLLLDEVKHSAADAMKSLFVFDDDVSVLHEDEVTDITENNAWYVVFELLNAKRSSEKINRYFQGKRVMLIDASFDITSKKYIATPSELKRSSVGHGNHIALVKDFANKYLKGVDAVGFSRVPTNEANLYSPLSNREVLKELYNLHLQELYGEING